MYRIPIYQVKLVRDGSHAADRRKLSSAAVAAELLQQYLDGADREHLVVLLLDTQNQLIGIHTASIGTLTAAPIHPREVFKSAILANAAAVLLAHNHPSGDPTPSPEDRAVTRQLVAAGATIGIEILDHIVLGETPRYCSFAESGILDPVPIAGHAVA